MQGGTIPVANRGSSPSKEAGRVCSFREELKKRVSEYNLIFFLSKETSVEPFRSQTKFNSMLLRTYLFPF